MERRSAAGGRSLDSGAVADHVAAALADAGLAGANALVYAVESIERDAKTGKVRRFIPIAGS